MGSNKRFEELISKVVDRKSQIDNLVAYLRDNTSYFYGPGSHIYHNNWEGGLLEHHCNVAENMIKIKNLLAPDISDESCVIVGLFHDLGKVGMPGQPYYIFNTPTPKQKQWGYVPDRPYYHGNVQPYMPVPHCSLWLLSKFVDLTPEEFQAIMIHDGQYVPDNKSYSGKECRLALIAHYADSWAGFIMEDTMKKNDDGKGYTRVKAVKESSPDRYRHLGIWKE